MRSASCRATANPASGSPSACCCRSGTACRPRTCGSVGSGDDGIAIIGRVLDAEQVQSVRAGFGLDGGPTMTGTEAFAAVMERGNALSLANGWQRAPAPHGPRPDRSRGTGRHRPAVAPAHGMHGRDRLVPGADIRAEGRRGGAHPRPLAT